MDGDAMELGPDSQVSRDRLVNVYVELIDSIGLSGREIASLSGTRPQYISDIKRRQRPLSHEMFRRTLVGLYGDYKWLISGDLPTDARRITALYPFIADAGGPVAPLPLFQRPFMGPRMTADDWDGRFVTVTSPVKEQVRAMHNPYILHLPFNDKSGRLRRGDYLLVNQTDTADSGYVLIKSGWGVKLVRTVPNGYEDAESGELHSETDALIIGNVVSLLLGQL